MWAMIAFAVKGVLSDQTDSLNPRAPDIQEITVREMIQVLELMQMHPKERLRRVILTGIWFNAINVGY